MEKRGCRLRLVLFSIIRFRFLRGYLFVSSVVLLVMRMLFYTFEFFFVSLIFMKVGIGSFGMVKLFFLVFVVFVRDFGVAGYFFE